jgi:hypothetical protein
MNNISKIAALGLLTFSLSCAYAQGPQDILKSDKQKANVLTPEDAQTVKEWIEAVEKICPMYNLFKDTQTFEHRIVRGSFKRLL